MTKDGTLVFCRKCATWKVREGFYGHLLCRGCGLTWDIAAEH